MAETIIPELTFTEFKKLKPSDLKQLKSCEVKYDGEYLFTFLNPQTDYIRVQVGYLAEMGNAIGGKKLEEIICEEVKV